MIRVTFKNVGQGDSIVIEWKKDNRNCIGIIDCNLTKSGGNPIVEHVKDGGFKRIDFLLLTHPHYDHFSGFYSLFQYCITNKIRVDQFLHTSSQTPEYLRTASRSIFADKELVKLFSFLRVMRDSYGMKIHVIEANPDLHTHLDDEFIMDVLAPTSVEKDKYVRGVKFPFDEEDGNSNPNANWLGSVLKIYNKSCCILLTSDVEETVLSAVGKKKGKLITEKLILGQIPHHGAKGNHNEPFWSMRKRVQQTPVVISVGDNGYDHPSQKVVDFFDKTNNFDLYSTNQIGGLSALSNEYSKEILEILDMFSVETDGTNSGKYRGDKVFEIEKDRVTPIY